MPNAFFIRSVLAIGLLALLRCPAAGELQTLYQTGASSNRVDIVFVGDGYTQADHDAGRYSSDVGAYLDHLFSGGLADPFPRYRNFFNAHAVVSVSNQSGADRPPDGVYRDTALDASYYSFGIERLLTVNNSKANAARDAALAGTGVTSDMQYAVVNDAKYGGAGGAYATFAGGNASAHEIALHEVAHSFADLADEYGGDGPYEGGEPREVNVTADASGAKWEHWIGFDDPRGANLDIGVFEGARYHDQGLYRPSANSKMRNLNRHFDAVSREKLILDIYQHVEPLDDYLDNSQSLLDPAELWVDVVDPAVIGVEWYVGGELSAINQGESFDPLAEGLGAGVWSIEARAYDLALDAAFDGSLLDLVRRDQHELEQRVVWTIEVSPPTPAPGDYNGDGLIGVEDYDAWRDAYGAKLPSPADGNADGLVDAADYTIWRDAVGSEQPAAVPEPTTTVLLAAPLFALRSQRRRGRQRRSDRRCRVG